MRRADSKDLVEMLRVERAAQALLAEQGVHLSAIPIPERVERPTDWNLGFVAEVGSRIVGMARLSRLNPELLCLDQVSVDPAFAGRGVGRLLLTKVVETARELGYGAVTGTTFRDVAFNAPFYTSLGCVEETDPHPAMRRQREVEQRLGLDQFGPRIVMRLNL